MFRCRLNDTMVYLGYLLPMIIVISVNLVVFGLVLHQILTNGPKLSKGKNHFSRRESSSYEIIKH